MLELRFVGLKPSWVVLGLHCSRAHQLKSHSGAESCLDASFLLVWSECMTFGELVGMETRVVSRVERVRFVRGPLALKLRWQIGSGPLPINMKFAVAAMRYFPGMTFIGQSEE